MHAHIWRKEDIFRKRRLNSWQNSITVFGVLALCTIKIDHIRARAMDQESIIITYRLGGTGGEGSLKRTVHKKIKLERKRKMGGGE